MYKRQTNDNANHEPKKIMDDVVAVSLGTGYSAAIKRDGSLMMWGDNSYGQFGNGTTESSTTPVSYTHLLVEIPEEKKTVHFNFKQPPRTGDMVVEARGLRKSFGDHHVYDGLDFTMYRGEKVALVGPNVAGKSTLLKMIEMCIRDRS